MTFQIALLQFQPSRKNVNRNIETIRELLHGIQADLVVLPELSNSGYLYESDEELLPFSENQNGSGPFLSALSDLATKTGGVIVSGYAERHHDQLYNSAAAITPVGIIQNYRKTHLFADEKLLFQPGDTGFNTFRWKDINIGMMICFDWIFPESARTLALLGAHIIAHPANLVMPYCQDAMVTRSIENGVFTITSNRIGNEELNDKKFSFTGKSQITAPDGNILYRGPENLPTVHVMEIEPLIADNKRISPQNHLIKDRRPQFYFH
jgi:predicted amidohydrolase